MGGNCLAAVHVHVDVGERCGGGGGGRGGMCLCHRMGWT